MAHYITETNKKNFQPMNANFGLFKELGLKLKTSRNEMNSMLRGHWRQFKIFRKRYSYSLPDELVM